LVEARWSRYVIDLNTTPRIPTPYDDKRPPGLNDIRRRSQSGAQWYEPAKTGDEVRALIAAVFEPYHRAIENELDRAATRFPAVFLVSGHTYPARGRDNADIVLGSQHGATAPAELTRAFADSLRRGGLSVALEQPFPGGYSVGRHARPVDARFATQVEVARPLVCRAGGVLSSDDANLDSVAIASLAVRLGEALNEVRALLDAWRDAAPTDHSRG
jgi:N-formylglutamate amidohydrolase